MIVTWIGDIASWIYVGNGFTIDLILLAFALTITGVFVWFIVDMKKQSENEKIKDKMQKSIKNNKTKNGVLFTCNSCGEIIDLENPNCHSCGSKKPSCMICLSDLKKTEEVIKTPCCQLYAHKEHIRNWLEINAICPNCKQELKIEELMPVNFPD